MRTVIILYLSVLAVFCQYETEYSGYGNNDEHEVAIAAKKSPYNKPIDYTNNEPRMDGETPKYPIIYPQFPNFNYNALIKNYISTQQLGQTNAQGQENVQKGGDMTNAGSNANEVSAGQTNYQTYKPSTYTPSSDVPNFNYNELVKNYISNQQLGQSNAQGQENVQKGGDQTNAGINSNTLSVGQANYQANAGKGGHGYTPLYQGPSYPTSDVPSSDPAFNYNALIGNIFKSQSLGQSNTQAQSNAQIGGAQTNVGLNQNTVTVGQTNYQAGGGKGGHGGYQPTYDASGYNPYGTAFLILPNFNFNYLAGNKVSNQQLGQSNQQGQTNVQKGGDQTNVGINTNRVEVGQNNWQSDASGYGRRRI